MVLHPMRLSTEAYLPFVSLLSTEYAVQGPGSSNSQTGHRVSEDTLNILLQVKICYIRRE